MDQQPLNLGGTPTAIAESSKHDRRDSNEVWYALSGKQGRNSSHGLEAERGTTPNLDITLSPPSPGPGDQMDSLH